MKIDKNEPSNRMYRYAMSLLERAEDQVDQFFIEDHLINGWHEELSVDFRTLRSKIRIYARLKLKSNGKSF